MARHEASAPAAAVDFHLPDEILAVIPTDPYEQLDVARKITSMAIASRVSRLEADAARLRRDLADRDRNEANLRARLAAALDENAKLAKERDSLAATAKKLARNLAKLEAFKKQLMKSLSEDNLLQLSETGLEHDAEDNLTARVPSWKDEVSSSHSSSDTSSRSTKTESTHGGGYQFSITPYIPQKVTPGSTPMISSSGGSPRSYSTGPSSPKFLSGPTSPTRSRSESQSAFSSWQGSSHQYSAPTSPPQRRSFTGRPRIDGKEFFRQARTRLSYEQFGAFLANIKEFNAQKQSREDTLSKAEEIFGAEHKDLYISFQNMLNRNQS
ncbi:uncharacterized protein C2845_PM15G22050 [Panicum miliaceum]|uniref:At4g15545-like C-terminal domain-containing protein n=1 Tax=Panicum miliaceum TaxID=4540 RepID=A0A3L6Q8U2_PANMI|nr:uncharacterized protein C2845_PM15G22050 [Panicum miliaceum]